MNLLPHLVVLVIGVAIGTIYGSWASDHYWKEWLENESNRSGQNWECD